MDPKKTRSIAVNYIARVEGEGALSVEIEDGQVTSCKLKIFEPPRFFEALLRGRDFREAPDITARICGICPVAYQTSAVQAMEDALGIHVDGQLGELRRMIYCGEWIESHTLHIYMLHAPDFLGFPDAIQLAKKHRKEVERGLRMKKAGNSLVALLGGREIHPINMKVGGFYKVPERSQLEALRDELLWARDAAMESVRWTAGFDFPDFHKDYEFISLAHPERYPFNIGTVKSNKGFEVSPQQYEEQIEEFQVPHSTALHARVKGRGNFLVGPMARYHHNFHCLSPLVKELAKDIGFSESCRNPYQSIIVRGLEVLYAFDEALRLIDNYEKPDAPSLDVQPRAGVGYGCSEAPRGTLYHRYEIDDTGEIQFALIVPPTSQNQPSIEEDLHTHIQGYAHLDDEALAHKCEGFIRNYDPCISCATHFLKLRCTRR